MGVNVGEIKKNVARQEGAKVIKKGLLGILILFLLIFGLYAGEEKEKKDRIAILPFESRGMVGFDNAGNFVADYLIECFKDRFDVTERTQLKKVLDESDFQLSDLVKSEENQKKISKVLDVKYLVLGSIDNIGEISVSLRMVEVQTAKVFKSGSISFKELNEFKSKLAELTKKLFMPEAEKAGYSKYLKMVDEAEDLYKKRNIRAALSKLEEAEGFFPGEKEAQKLRGKIEGEIDSFKKELQKGCDVTISIKRASIKGNKPNGEPWDAPVGPPDCYVVVYLDKIKVFSTKIARDSFNPKWNVTSKPFTVKKTQEMKIYVYDSDLAEHDFVGGCIYFLYPIDVLEGVYKTISFHCVEGLEVSVKLKE